MSSRRGLVAVAVAALTTALVACTGPIPQTPQAPSRSGPASGSPLILDQSFDDEGGLDTSVWNTCHWWDDDGCTISSNDELEWYRADQVSVVDGVLRLTAEPKTTEASDGETYDFASGMVTTGPAEYEGEAKVAWTYGSVEARVRTPAGRGLWPAMWMLPADSESRPEIDILEVIGQQPDELIMHLHPEDRDADSPDRRYRLPTGTFADRWHTIRLDWLPGRLTWYVDDRRVWTLTGDQVPDEPMYLVFNLAVGGAYPGTPDDSTPFPATFEIDYVRVTEAA